MRRLLVCVVAGFVLSGCAGYGVRAANERYDKMMDSFLGATESSLVDAWGVPDRTYEIDDSKFLKYSSTRIVPVPAPMPVGTIGYPRFGVYGGGSRSLSCENTFKIRNGIVVSVRYRGNNCKS